MLALRSPHDPEFSSADAEQLARLLKSLAHPVRLTIVHLLREGPMAGLDLHARIPFRTKETIDFHLRALRYGGVVVMDRPRVPDARGGRPGVYRLASGVLALAGDLLTPAGAR